jgi:hypothetical protein
MWKSEDRAPSLRVLPYNWGKNTEEPQKVRKILKKNMENLKKHEKTIKARKNLKKHGKISKAWKNLKKHGKPCYCRRRHKFAVSRKIIYVQLYI